MTSYCDSCQKDVEIHQMHHCQCRHCKNCLKTYISHIIDDDDVRRYKCFFYIKCPKDDCGGRLTLTEIKDLVNRELLYNYQERVRECEKTKNIIKDGKPCPMCHTPTKYDLNHNYMVICTHCHHKFCKVCLISQNTFNDDIIHTHYGVYTVFVKALSLLEIGVKMLFIGLFFIIASPVLLCWKIIK